MDSIRIKGMDILFMGVGYRYNGVNDKKWWGYLC